MDSGQKFTPARSGLRLTYSDKPVTAWAGMAPFAELFERSGLRGFIRDTPWPKGKSNNATDPAETFMAFLVTLWTGGFRFAHTAYLRGDEGLRALFDLREVPAACTFTRWFNRFTQDDLDPTLDSLNRRLWAKVKSLTLTLDLDSSVFTREGAQAGAERGYNPTKNGHRSHHPLFAFAADIRMVVNCWLRPGAAGAANNATGFLDQTLDILAPAHRVGLVRADSGFCSEKFIAHTESKGLDYVIAAPFRTNFRHHVGGAKGWVSVARGIEVSETLWRLNPKSAARRVVLLRQHVFLKPDAQGKTLFPHERTYRYSAYVTSLTLPPAEVWRLYRGRADCENRLKELKHDFGADKLCLKDFWATEAALKGVIFAYNAMAIARQIHTQDEGRQTLGTKRATCYAVGGVLGREGRTRLLRLGLGKERRPWFEGLWSAAQTCDPWEVSPVKKLPPKPSG